MPTAPLLLPVSQSRQDVRISDPDGRHTNPTQNPPY